MSDLIVTWPKSRPLGSYIAECLNAAHDGKVINYRVRSKPDERHLGPPGDRRLYRVHNGWVRGYTNIERLAFREDGEVARVRSDAFSGFWPRGWYIVCVPFFHDCPTMQMEGFRGYRYFDRSLLNG